MKTVIFRTESTRDGVGMGKVWMCVLAIAGCVVGLGCQAESDYESWVLFEVKGGRQLSLAAYGKEFAKTHQKFCLAKVLPGAKNLSVRQEEDGTTSFLIDCNEPIVFRQDGREVKVSLIDWVGESKTHTWTCTIAVQDPSVPPENSIQGEK